jgi:glycosyltransferase involved in cell wall biosynthesis
MPDLPSREPIANAPVSVILPVRAAASAVGEVLAGWAPVLQGLQRDCEIIVVDEDGSSAAAVADFIATEVPRLTVQRLAQAGGAGAAFRTGLATAKHPLIVFAPCDPRYTAADLKKLLGAIDKVDCVSGCRTTAMPGSLRWLGRAWRLTVRALFGVPLEPLPGWLGWKQWLFRQGLRLWTGVRMIDINCPFKLFRRDMFARLPIQSEGAFVYAEILAKGNFLECPMGEVEVSGPADDPAQELRPLWREARRVLGHPEFGASPRAAPAKSDGKKKKRRKKK